MEKLNQASPQSSTRDSVATQNLGVATHPSESNYHSSLPTLSRRDMFLKMEGSSFYEYVLALDKGSDPASDIEGPFRCSATANALYASVQKMLQAGTIHSPHALKPRPSRGVTYL